MLLSPAVRSLFYSACEERNCDSIREPARSICARRILLVAKAKSRRALLQSLSACLEATRLPVVPSLRRAVTLRKPRAILFITGAFLRRVRFAPGGMLQQHGRRSVQSDGLPTSASTTLPSRHSTQRSPLSVPACAVLCPFPCVSLCRLPARIRPTRCSECSRRVAIFRAACRRCSDGRASRCCANRRDTMPIHSAHAVRAGWSQAIGRCDEVSSHWGHEEPASARK